MIKKLSRLDIFGHLTHAIKNNGMEYRISTSDITNGKGINDVLHWLNISFTNEMQVGLNLPSLDKFFSDCPIFFKPTLVLTKYSKYRVKAAIVIEDIIVVTSKNGDVSSTLLDLNLKIRLLQGYFHSF